MSRILNLFTVVVAVMALFVSVTLDSYDMGWLLHPGDNMCFLFDTQRLTALCGQGRHHEK